MNKYLVFLLAAVMIFSMTGCGEKDEPDTDVQSNVGAVSAETEAEESPSAATEEVWKVTLVRSYGNDNEVNKKSKYFYDEQGRIVFEEHYANEEETEQYPFYRYTYHEDGSYSVDGGIEKFEYDARGNELYYESPAIIRVKTYDENGNMTSSGFGADGMEGRTEYFYDDQGNCIRQLHYGEDGAVRLEELYEYDDRGNLLREESIYEDASGVTEYTYNDRNDLTSEKHYTNGKLDKEYYSEYTYNEAGDLLTQDAYSGGGPDSSYGAIREYHARYVYNEQGLLISLIAGNELSETNIDNKRYEYDENGNLIYEQHLTDGGYINHERIYEYDENGNVILDHTTYKNYEGGVKKGDSLTKYAYDEFGNRIMEENYLYEEFNYRHEWRYELIRVVQG